MPAAWTPLDWPLQATASASVWLVVLFPPSGAPLVGEPLQRATDAQPHRSCMVASAEPLAPALRTLCHAQSLQLEDCWFLCGWRLVDAFAPAACLSQDLAVGCLELVCVEQASCTGQLLAALESADPRGRLTELLAAAPSPSSLGGFHDACLLASQAWLNAAVIIGENQVTTPLIALLTPFLLCAGFFSFHFVKMR